MKSPATKRPHRSVLKAALAVCLGAGLGPVATAGEAPPPPEPEYVEYLEPAIANFLAGEAVPRAETPSFGCDIKSVYYILPKAL